MAYKGYTINQTLLGEYFIMKGGHHIGYALSLAHAKQVIDELTA